MRTRQRRHIVLSTAAVAAATALLLAAPAPGKIVCTPGICYLIGPATPKAKSTPGMTFRLPRRASGGEVLKGVAGRFAPGEFVELWDYRGRRASDLNGGTASRRGFVTVHRDTSMATPGRHRICAQGMRTRRIACATYFVASNREPTTGDPYQPPTTDDPYQPPTTGDPYEPPTTGEGYQPPTTGDPYQPPTSG